VTAPKRPPLARKHTPATEAKRNAVLDEGVRIVFEGETYEVRAGDLNAIDVRDLRKELGLSFMGLMRGLHEDADIDLLVGLIWLARRVRGENLPYAAVAAEIGYLAMDGIEVDQIQKAEEVDNDPEG